MNRTSLSTGILRVWHRSADGAHARTSVTITDVGNVGTLKRAVASVSGLGVMHIAKNALDSYAALVGEDPHDVLVELNRVAKPGIRVEVLER